MTDHPRTPIDIRRARESAIKYHRAQICRAAFMLSQSRWTPSEAANHRESHERLLRSLEHGSSPEPAG